MSLSREIAKWLQSNPGPLKGPDAENVWLQAKIKFITDRRWREEVDMAVFMRLLDSLGYRLEHRTIHGGKEGDGVFMLALPAKHRGF